MSCCLVTRDRVSKKQQEDYDFWEESFHNLVEDYYTITFSTAFKYNELDPTEVIFGNDELSEVRQKLVVSACSYTADNKRDLAVLPLDTKITFKPFTMNEIVGRKFNISSKLDEIFLKTEEDC